MSDDMSMVSPSSAGEHGVLRSMQEVAMSSQEASKMLRTYNIAWWGNNYYDVNELGHISVCPDPDVPEARVDLAELVKAREAQGQRLPALFCFPQILQHRLRSINAAFKRARESYGYNGDYFLVYPIKVNQHRRVIESLIHSGEPLGLEAGSKAELMAVLAHAGMTRSVIVCNGYKDREYIRLALVGEKMGHKVYLVIEKMSEIAIVLEEAERLNVVPRLGVRARLASQGSGKWQSSGGEKSKFGLAATQVLQLVEILRAAGHLESLQLLHFHLGSQMANIRDIATGVRESARFYVELHKLGVNIQCFDVGGGLGVDYEGTRSQSDCSVNYGLNEYANNIIWAIGDACEEKRPAAPDGDHRIRPRGDRAPYRAGFQHHRRGAQRIHRGDPAGGRRRASAAEHVGNLAGDARNRQSPLAARMAARQPDGPARYPYRLLLRHFQPAGARLGRTAVSEHVS